MSAVRDWGVFRIHVGDCRDVLAAMPDASVDSIVTDPPYELGFMGKSWDRSGVAFDPDTWRAVLRVLKPGGHLLAFGGTRTFHRLACAIEDAGFELRDSVLNLHGGGDCPWLAAWGFGSGFPKSHNGSWGGTALKPAFEPIVMARKPLIGTVEQNWREHGTGALNIDACRVDSDGARPLVVGDRRDGNRVYRDGLQGSKAIGETTLGRWPANLTHDGSDEVLAAFPHAPGQIADASSSSSSRKTQNVYGAMKRGNGREGEPSQDSDNVGAVGFRMKPGARRGDNGSAARFFYCAKASRTDRNEGLDGMPETRRSDADGMLMSDPRMDRPQQRRASANHHPTVKPTDLMRYLCRLVTPPGGIVFDPFLGSGSTGKAAVLEDFRFVGVEQSAEYADIAERRIAHAAFGPLAFGAVA